MPLAFVHPSRYTVHPVTPCSGPRGWPMCLMSAGFPTPSGSLLGTTSGKPQMGGMEERGLRLEHLFPWLSSCKATSSWCPPVAVPPRGPLSTYSSPPLLPPLSSLPSFHCFGECSAVFVSWGCHDKLPQPGWVNTIEMYSLTVRLGEGGKKSEIKVSPGLVPSSSS